MYRLSVNQPDVSPQPYSIANRSSVYEKKEPGSEPGSFRELSLQTVSTKHPPGMVVGIGLTSGCDLILADRSLALRSRHSSDAASSALVDHGTLPPLNTSFSQKQAMLLITPLPSPHHKFEHPRGLHARSSGANVGACVNLW